MVTAFEFSNPLNIKDHNILWRVGIPLAGKECCAIRIRGGEYANLN
jgi:hypothetical protein